ncbi:MAG: DNA gyrase inhibitor YacG [Rhodobacteraceae bacterium]|nr:DNA gyrase inhibitor YacG [Paracoccaceae bacterium]
MSCPICQRRTDPRYRPFCSRRCADIDLGRWLTGSYRIPGEAGEAADTPGEDSPDGPAPPPPRGRPH